MSALSQHNENMVAFLKTELILRQSKVWQTVKHCFNIYMRLNTAACIWIMYKYIYIYICMYVCPIYPSVNTVCIRLTFYINLEKSKA